MIPNNWVAAQDRFMTLSITVTGELRINNNVPIQVRVSPPQQTISVGQATHFNCTVSGFPLYGVTWTKNLRPVLPNERIRVLGTDVLSISSVVRDDRGVYQCFAHNHFDSAQASGALLLGGRVYISPSLAVGNGVSAKMLQTSRRGRGQQDDSKHIGQGWRTTGTRAIGGTRRNILGTPPIKTIWYPPGEIDVKNRTSFRALKAQTVLKNEQNVGFRCSLREKHCVTD
ncbi:ig-like domain-containing protein [Trichonephila clavipes]|nr:ig-like domain-containing protein [Trichonephila clavipes]